MSDIDSMKWPATGERIQVGQHRTPPSTVCAGTPSSVTQAQRTQAGAAWCRSPNGDEDGRDLGDQNAS